MLTLVTIASLLLSPFHAQQLDSPSDSLGFAHSADSAVGPEKSTVTQPESERLNRSLLSPNRLAELVRLDKEEGRRQRPRSGVRRNAHTGIDAQIPFQRLTDDDGHLWAWGGSYKASASPEGFQYIPFLGSDAPHNWPLQFQFASASRGGAELETLDHVTPTFDGDAFVFDRGAVVERYELATHRVEQLFELEDVRGEGDLVVRFRVLTDLAARSTAAGFEFDSGYGSVRYGTATVFDANARQAHVPARLEDGAIELTVTEEFLNQATGRITIDPILTTFGVFTGPTYSVAADLAYDATAGSYLVAEERAFSATDHDVFLALLSENGFNLGSTFLDITANDWRYPAVANDNFAERFLVVAQVKSIGATTNVILGQLVRTNLEVIPGVLYFSGTTPNAMHPDVGGNPNAPAGSYCVVWESEATPGVDHDIFARIIGPHGQVQTDPIAVDASVATLDCWPSISNSCGFGGVDFTRTWNIAWEREFNPSDHDIRGALIRYDGLLLFDAFDIDSSSRDDRYPSASSSVDEYRPGPRRWMAVYESRGTSGPSVVGASVLDGNQVVTQADLAALQGVGQGWSDYEPSVDSNGDQFIVAWEETVPSMFVPDDWDVRAASFVTAGDQLLASESFLQLNPSTDPETGAQVYSRHSSGGGTQYSMITWVDDPFNDGDVLGALHKTPSLYGNDIGVNYCSDTATANSTGQPGVILATGSATLPDEPMQLSAYNLPPQRLAMFFVGTFDTLTMPAGSSGFLCVTGQIGRYGGANIMSTGSSGSVGLFIDKQAIPTPNGNTRSIIQGETLYFQCWHRDQGGNNFTDATKVLFF